MDVFFQSLTYEQLLKLKHEIELYLLENHGTDKALEMQRLFDLGEKELKDIEKKFTKQLEQVKNNAEYDKLKRQIEQVKLARKIKEETSNL